MERTTVPSSLIRLLLVAGALLGGAVGLAAQNDPHLGYAFPAGGRAGTVFEVTVGGQFLASVEDVIVSGAGVKGAVIEHYRALSRKQMGELRKRLRDLQRRKRRGAAAGSGRGEQDPPFEYHGRALETMSARELAELRARLFDPKKQPNAQLAETVVLHVAIAPDATPGARELRLVTPSGLSNPLRFHVGRGAEYREREPNDHAPDAGVPASWPVTINGQILPGDVDRFRFTARAGQSLVAQVRARALIPYLADAVPGWFQATLTLRDGRGRELAFVDDYLFHPDPVLHCTIPADGEYVLEIRDAIYRGREDFVYRLTLGELPFVTGLFPLGGRAGEATTVELTGWNLAVSKLRIGEAEPPGRRFLGGPGSEVSANAFPFVVGTLPETFEVEPNDRLEDARWFAQPKVVNGRVGRPGDRDVFRLTGRAGDVVVAEVTARRLQSPLDSVLWITDVEGRELARNDDHDDPGAGLTTHQADSRLSFRLPADGDYYLHLADAQGGGGDAYAYRLRISGELPDFELRLVPSGVNVRAGASVPLTVHALRRDGFEGPIGLRLRGAPRGFVLSGGRVPRGSDVVQVTLTAPGEPLEEPLRLTVEGRAKIDGREVRHLAVPAEDMMQAFLYRHLVPADDLLVSVRKRRGAAPVLRLVDTKPVRLPVGGTATVRLRGPRRRPAGKLVLELRDGPDGVRIEESSPVGRDATLVLYADPERAEAGWQGNAIVEVFLERSAKSRDGKPTGRIRRTSLGVLPAFRLVIAGP